MTDLVPLQVTRNLYIRENLQLPHNSLTKRCVCLSVRHILYSRSVARVQTCNAIKPEVNQLYM